VKEANLCAALIVKEEEHPVVEVPAEVQGLLSECQSILGELMPTTNERNSTQN